MLYGKPFQLTELYYMIFGLKGGRFNPKVVSLLDTFRFDFSYLFPQFFSCFLTDYPRALR